MFEGILSCSTAPGIGVVVVASAGAGAGAAGAAVLRAGAAPPATLAGALRGGGATGVVAMTWISGSFVALELEASWAATVLGATASTAASAQGNPRSADQMTDVLVRSVVPAKLPMCPLTMDRARRH